MATASSFRGSEEGWLATAGAVKNTWMARAGSWGVCACSGARGRAPRRIHRRLRNLHGRGRKVLIQTNTKEGPAQRTVNSQVG